MRNICTGDTSDRGTLLMHGRNRDLFRRFLSLLHSPFRTSLAHLASVSRHRQVSMYALDARYTDFSWKLVRQWAECASPNAKLGSGLASTVRSSTHTQQKPHRSHTHLSHPIAVRRRTIPLKWYAGGGVRRRVLRRCGVQLLCLRQPHVYDEPNAVRYSRCVAETGIRPKRGV